MIGKRLNHYQLSEKLGAGGMGAVYRARDQKLGRDVAIKVLPEEFAKDANRVARFQREAKLLASLNHPNIAAIHGLEEAEGINFLVLELVEGDTLADQIKRGPIPVEESLKLALQIAEALEAAHEKGVIHRDLKPANIKVTPDGKVKVLDFGLAKAFAADQEGVVSADSPTLTMTETQEGVILGTAAYMSPEQARGKPVDRRTDIWAFGCVLYEMLTGRAAFSGKDLADILAAVIRGEPDWGALPENLHGRVREVLQRCLEKDARNRYGGINDARVDIQRVLADPGGVLAQPSTIMESQKGLRLGFAGIAAAVILSAVIAGAVVWNLKSPKPGQIARFYHELPEDHQFGSLMERAFAVSPDGSQLVYKTERGLWLRSMAELNARFISGTEDNPQKPFFSPDGRWVGYVSGADGKLKKISINGGAPVLLTDHNSTGFLSWGKDDAIVYASGGSIMRVSANGGSPEFLVKTKEASCYSPQILPDGKTVMYTTGTDPFKIAVQSIGSGDRKELITGDTAQYLPTGHILYAVDNDLLAVAFDLDSLEVTGGQIPIIKGVLRSGGAPQYALSDSGTLAYMTGRTGAAVPTRRTLVWVDRDGKEEPLAAPPNDYRNPHISPDGTKAALSVVAGSSQNIWIWDLVHMIPVGLTFDDAVNNNPLWTLDGKRVFFRSTAKEGVYWKAADGTGNVQWLFSLPDRICAPASWAGNGKTLILQVGGDNFDIGAISMEKGHDWRPLLQENHMELQPQISPDGRWMAYMSDESGQYEIYIRPSSEVNAGRWQVSESRGNSPLWSPDGRELFYRNGDSVVAVAVETDPSFRHGRPKVLFRGNYVGLTIADGHPWDVHPDGKRFLMIKESGSAAEATPPEIPRQINVVLNWFEELKPKAPIK